MPSGRASSEHALAAPLTRAWPGRPARPARWPAKARWSWPLLVALVLADVGNSVGCCVLGACLLRRT
ncbi:MAG TPA: hypothetical protein VFS40_05400 [Gemmatimonadales bacterium]|nr:hypothetical protein [Gemmatimonadales bacterium]